MELGEVPSEFRVLAGLRHANIAVAHDVVFLSPNKVFVVMQFVAGETLRERMRRGRVAISQTALFVAKIADALRYAHEHRLNHGRISPFSILIDPDEEPILFDFAAARPPSRWRIAAFDESYSYQCPDRIRDSLRHADARSDIFSLGVMLYELLTGHHPFQGKTPRETRGLILKADTPRPTLINRDVPRALECICLRALANPASKRYATAGEMAAEIFAFLSRA